MPDVVDRQLLFGLLALQNGLIDQAGLVAAFQAWSLDRSRELADHLAALGRLDEDRRSIVEALVRVHLASGGDAREGLASLAIDEPTRGRLAAIADPEIDATLPFVGSEPTVPDAIGPRDEDDATLAAGAPPGATIPGATIPVAIAPGDDPAADGRRFRILRPHANGNLGVVFVALDLELNREVALKRIREEYADDPTSRGRFLIEAEVTGGLEHPGIVPVHGLGTLDDGRPYYAMRLIRGDSFRDAIEAFHREGKAGPERALAFRRLLRSFIDVCNAVGYAHSRGVLHRDLKPANVVVGGHGETFLVDWGLAKAWGHAPPEAAERTLTPSSTLDGSSETLPGQALGTPAYMSPVQARGDLERLGPRSDVYSLGATLYHVLTGKAPFQGPAATVLKAVEAGDFRRPRELDAAIDPALEAVVLKAMAREPEGRYPSSRALADDVDRWLADERVEAHAEPWTRALNRWLTRHRTGVTGLAAAGLVALVGLGVVSAVQAKGRRDLDAKNFELSRINADLVASNRQSAVQRKRAEENERRAIDAVKRFKDAIAENPELKQDPRLEPLRKALLREPLAFFQELQERLQDDDDARPEALLQLARVARDHAGLISEIGSLNDAIQAYRRSVDVMERLDRDHPDVIEYRIGLAECRSALGAALANSGRDDEARPLIKRAAEALEQLARDHPDDPRPRARLAEAEASLGVLSNKAGRIDEARSFFERSIDALERLVRDQPDNVGHQGSLAKARLNYGILLRGMGRTDEARANFERSIEVGERLARDHPDVTKYRISLADGQYSIGALLHQEGRDDEAWAAFERSGEALESLVRDHPEVAMNRSSLGVNLANRAMLLGREGRADEARTAFERAIEIFESLAREYPAYADYGERLGNLRGSLAMVLRDAGRHDESRVAFERSVEVLEPLVRDHPDVARYRAALAASRTNLGIPLFDAGRLDEARTNFERAIELYEGLARDEPDDVEHRVMLATNHFNRGNTFHLADRRDEARAAYDRAVEILEPLARDHPDKPDLVIKLGHALELAAEDDLKDSRFAEARGRLLRGIDRLKKVLNADPENAVSRRLLREQLGLLLRAERALGHEDEAVRAAIERAECLIGDPETRDVEAKLQAALGGETPGNPAEWSAVLQRTIDTMPFAAAAELLGRLVEAQSGLPDDQRGPDLFSAAWASVLAAAGRGIGAPADDAEKARLRGRALGWLKDAAKIWSRLLESDRPQDREAAAKALKLWRENAELAGVRDPEALRKLPDEERAAWEALWGDVAAMLRKAEGG